MDPITLAIIGGGLFGFFGKAFLATGRGVLLIFALDGLLAVFVAAVL